MGGRRRGRSGCRGATSSSAPWGKRARARADSSAEPPHVHVGLSGAALMCREAGYRLRTLNLAAAALHLVQAIVVVILATDFSLPITAAYLAGPPGTPPGPATVQVDLPTGLAVAGFLALSFLAHLIVATVWFPRYIRDLSHSINRALGGVLLLVDPHDRRHSQLVPQPNGCSNARRAAGRTTWLGSAATSSSASWRSRSWPGRSSAARSPADAARSGGAPDRDSKKTRA